MGKICVRSDEVLDSGAKLKDYLDEAIGVLSEEYIESAHQPDVIPKNEVMNLIQEHRNILLCMKEICKKRKKF